MAVEDLTGAEIAEAFIRIRPKAEGFEREASRQVEPVAKQVGDTFTRGVDGRLRDAKGRFVKTGEDIGEGVGRGVGRGTSLSLGKTLTAGAFTAFVAKVTTSAAELEQQVGGTSAVFGRYEDTITRFAEGADEAAGLSEQAARRLTSQIGGLLQGFGFTQQEAAKTSVDLAQLGADLSATYGGTAPEAVEALGAALRGEFDPLEHFGISLNETIVNLKAVQLGLAQSTGNVSQHAKAQAALAIITERSSAAQGQFAREADTAAGSAAIAQAKMQNSADDLGKSFLPIYQKLSKVVGFVAEGFDHLPEPIKLATVAGVGFAALAGPLAKVKSVVDGLRDSLSGAGGGVSGLGAKISGLAKAGVVAAGIASIVSELNALDEASKKTGDSFESSLPDPSRIDDFIAAVNKGVEQFNTLSDKVREDAGGYSEQLASAGKFFLNAISGGAAFDDSIEKNSKSLEGLGSQLQVQTARAEEMRKRVELLANDLGVSGSAVKDFVAKFAGLDITQVPLERLELAFREAQKPGADMAKVAEILGVKVATAGQQADDAAKKFAKAKDVFFGVVDAQRSLVDATDKIADARRNEEEANRRVGDAQHDYVESLKGISDAQQAYQDSLRQIDDAQIAYQDSLKRVGDAEQQRERDLRSVADAQEAVTEAQENLNRALAGTSEDDSLKLRSAALRVKESEIALAEAQRLRGRPAEKGLAVERASISLGEARLEQQRLEEEVRNRAGVAADALAEAQSRLDDAQRTAADSADGVVSAQRGVETAAKGVEDAQRGAADAADAVTEAQRNSDAAARGVRDAQREAADAHTAVKDAEYDAAKAAIELRDRQIELWGTAVANNTELGKLRDWLLQLQTDFPATADAVQPLIDKLNQLSPPKAPKDLSPEEFATKYLGGGPYTREQAEQAIQFKALELGLPLGTSIPDAQEAIAQRLQPRASGGPVKAGSPYLVGERGRPEVFVPSTDGRIEQATSGAAKVITLHQENHFNEWPTDQALERATDRLTLLAGGW